MYEYPEPYSYLSGVTVKNSLPTDEIAFDRCPFLFYIANVYDRGCATLDTLLAYWQMGLDKLAK